ncbi:tetratricopeptide repeat protein [Streptomyces sp. NBC_00620]|uniref:tetratricopeptide repeat protein n=1 Tax=Streptomyces sp. NBC_00620 TaxID=2903666 RepID=UPI0022541FF6|nr:tetratricopeptide repeat protein [Streptomyces sp. NBC_00620]MCX4974821.1 tetratricopeptide repeat protein [Streptomyces sp. NBC_00620]
MTEAGQFDAFVSYAHEDEPWAKALAENLVRLRLHVWLDQWELVGGQLVALRLQDGLAGAGAVVPVVSRHWTESGWCGEEFAAAMAKAVAGGQRVIPVLLGEVELPPFIASRLYFDFRRVASPSQYETLVRQLDRAVRGLPTAERPASGGALVVPDEVVYRPAGPTYAELRVDTGSVTFSTAGSETSCPPRGVDRSLEQHLWMLQRARARAVGGLATRRQLALGEATAPGGAAGALVGVGAVLGESFVCGEVAAALAKEEGLAQARHASLRIGLTVDDPRWVDLPWETLVVPGVGQPLVLSEHVELYRRVRRESPPVAVQVPGPLRILAVVASPESGGGELLDYERELSRILDAVDPARSGHGAYVRVLNWGSLAEIHAALEQERFHVLHLSCHAKPGILLLEDERGQVDEVDARRFMAEGLPTDRGVPLVVLAGCSTARTPLSRDSQERPADEEGNSDEEGGPDTSAGGSARADVSPEGRARAGLARELLARGVPAVLAMTEAVTDHYATELAAETYEALARAEHPDPLTALSHARRTLEARRRQLPDNTPRAMGPEWATPALFLAGPPLPLFDRTRGADRVLVAPEVVLDEGMVVRKVGEFVGRRAELRQLLAALRNPQRAGVLVHGIGGVGKSTLAAELLHHYGIQNRLIVPVSATTTRNVDAVLEALRQRLNAYCLAADLPETDPLRRVAVALTDARSPWRDRWELVRQIVLPRLPVLMIVDNAEDLLTRTTSGDGWQPSDPALADLLAAWTAASPRTRLLVTSRYPFSLPQRAHGRLTVHHLGPLSLAETRKLIWRLPGLDALGPADQIRAYTDVGGHPRALEYLDALLRGGQARFPDIADRMEAALETRGIHDPERWLADMEGDLDTALAETVTLAVDDILLDTLLDQLGNVPGARQLLDGMAVYRTPVDRTGAAWQLSQLTTPPEPDPVLRQRLQTVNTHITQARAAGAGPENGYGLSPETIAEHEAVWRELQRPPVDLDTQGGKALKRLLELGLVSPAPAPQDQGGSRPSGLTVHHWTADALRQRARPDALKAAHRRAAAYWQWRVNVWPQPRADDITQLIEVRHHHHEADDLDQADAVTQYVCSQLHTWGAWDWEQHLIEETLTWLPARSRPAAAHIHQLGMIAQERGDYGQAEERYRASLAILEELGDRSGIASSYHQLGIIAELRGDYGRAEERYRASLTIKEELGDRSGIASSYHQLGMIAQLRGDYGRAEERYRASLAILEELGDRSGIASSYHQLGRIAQERGDYGQAEERYRASLAILEELGDRSGIASSYHQLGTILELRGDYGQAEERYRASLTIKEELGDRSGIASSYGQLGIIAQLRGDYGRAEERYRASLAIAEELGDRSGIAISYHQLGMIAQLRGDYGRAEERYRASLAIKEELGDRSGIAISYHQLGIIAQLRGDYGQAEERYRASLTIKEELGNRSGIASSYGQLGMIAQLRGDYGQAEERYRASLTIKEELGNRSGIATSYAQLGELRTTQQRPAEGVPYTLRALTLQLEIGSPPDTALYWLGQQRALMGDDAFRSIIDDLLPDDAATAVMNATQPQAEPPPQEGDDTTRPDPTTTDQA